MATNALTRWNPNRELTSMRDVVDRLFDDGFFRPFRLFGDLGTGFGTGISMDIYEDGDNYVVEAALPGVNPEDVDITLQRNTVSIKGRLPETQAQEGRNYLLRELSGGEFVRTVTLPVEVNADQVNATFKHGMLHLILPKAAAYQAKRIQVKSSK